MGTTANIIAKTADGRWGRIYTHWDGYPDHHGPILLDHYQEQEKVDALVSLGDLSVLGEEIGRKHSFERKAKPGTTARKWCLAYGRDRGEKNVAATFAGTVEAAYEAAIEQGAEFIYVWNGRSWAVGVPNDPGNLIPLRAFMKGDVELKQTVRAFGGDFVLGQRVVRAGDFA